MVFAIMIFSFISLSVLSNIEKAWAQSVIATVDVGDGPNALELQPFK